MANGHSNLDRQSNFLVDVIEDFTHPYFNEAFSYDYDVAVIHLSKSIPSTAGQLFTTSKVLESGDNDGNFGYLNIKNTILIDSNESVADKVADAQAQGLKIIAFIGETLEQRKARTTIAGVTAQIKAIADKVSNWGDVTLAYKPVWTIGTGKVATPAQVQEVHFEVRKWLKDNVSAEVSASTKIIYGAPVSEGIAKVLAEQPDVDGCLVDEASPSPKPEFIDIFKAAI